MYTIAGISDSAAEADETKTAALEKEGFDAVVVMPSPCRIEP
jgi:hypothetical protein